MLPALPGDASTLTEALLVTGRLWLLMLVPASRAV
jgi:hypothetical protein